MKKLSIICFSFFSLLILLTLNACSARGYAEAPQMAMTTASGGMARMAYENAAIMPEAAYDTADFYGYAQTDAELMFSTNDFSDPLAANQTRKLTKSADLRIRVETLESTEKPMTDLMEKYQAWTASTGVYENFRNYSIRVPTDYYDAMLEELSNIGRMLRRTEYTEDVTLRYYDLEGRLATRLELLKTYQSYLTKANNIDEIMTVERRIAELQWEIDQTGTQFRNLVNQIDYSTINVEITGPVGTVTYSSPTLKDKMAELFGSFGSVLSSTVVVLTGIVIYGAPAVLLAVLLFWVLFGRIGLLKKLWRLAAGKK